MILEDFTSICDGTDTAHHLEMSIQNVGSRYYFESVPPSRSTNAPVGQAVMQARHASQALAASGCMS
jgi:hypothetical protein